MPRSTVFNPQDAFTSKINKYLGFCCNKRGIKTMFVLIFFQLLVNRGLGNKLLSQQSDQICTLFANSHLKNRMKQSVQKIESLHRKTQWCEITHFRIGSSKEKTKSKYLMLQIVHNAKQSIFKWIKLRPQMRGVPKYNQKHTKLIPKSNQKSCGAQGSSDILKHWKLNVQKQSEKYSLKMFTGT